MAQTQYVVVEWIDAEQVYLGIPDTRNQYHQVQISLENLLELHKKIEAQLGFNLIG